jgi:hypothetical protein
MRSNQPGDVDGANFARDKIARLAVHEQFEKFPGAAFGAGVQDGQPFQRAETDQEIEQSSGGMPGGARALSGFTTPSRSFTTGLMLKSPPMAVTAAGTRPERRR